MTIDFDQMLDDAGREVAEQFSKKGGIKTKTLKGTGKVALSVAATGAVTGGAVAGFSALRKAEAKEESVGNLTNPYDSSVASNISSYRYGRHIS